MIPSLMVRKPKKMRQKCRAHAERRISRRVLSIDMQHQIFPS
uniref:Uncharacterized protein n=1 Tax=Romanomermis culicivorax TaxID=13658 RepID=A0A915K8Q8_ROMCU